jgi:peptide/nickel transport system ATP-binding protein
MVECRGLNVAIGGRAIVRGVDLRVGPGIGVAIAGRSGSGKSTLARALVGLEPELSGSLTCAGRELVGAPRRDWKALRSRVQLVWQDPAAALDPHLSIRRAIDEARALAGRPRYGREDEKLWALLDQVALPVSLLERLPGELSGGQRQRAALARALAAEPALVIADEVTSALDRPVAWAIVELLRGLRARGVGLVMISHDLSLLPGTVDEVVVLDGGEVVERGATAELLRRPGHATTRALVAAAPQLAVAQGGAGVV